MAPLPRPLGVSTASPQLRMATFVPAPHPQSAGAPDPRPAQAHKPASIPLPWCWQWPAPTERCCHSLQRAEPSRPSPGGCPLTSSPALTVLTVPAREMSCLPPYRETAEQIANSLDYPPPHPRRAHAPHWCPRIGFQGAQPPPPDSRTALSATSHSCWEFHHLKKLGQG